MCEIALEREEGGNDRKRKGEKSKSKLSAQNLWKNLGKTKDLDSVGCT